MTFRIAVTGPESTGKTILTEKLSAYYHCPMVEEYARKYLENLNRKYDFADVEKIAQEQMKIEDQIIATSPKMLISDTELIVIKIWMEFKYGLVASWLEDTIRKRKFDLYLLCFPDLPWEYDPLRENPGLGEFFFEWYQKELDKRQFNYVVIKGNESERFSSAVLAINSNFM